MKSLESSPESIAKSSQNSMQRRRVQSEVKEVDYREIVRLMKVMKTKVGDAEFLLTALTVLKIYIDGLEDKSDRREANRLNLGSLATTLLFLHKDNNELGFKCLEILNAMMSPETAENILTTSGVSKIVTIIQQSENKETIRLGIKLLSKIHLSDIERIKSLLHQEVHEAIIGIMDYYLKEPTISKAIVSFITGIAPGFDNDNKLLSTKKVKKLFKKGGAVAVNKENEEQEESRDFYQLKVQQKIVEIMKVYSSDQKLVDASLLCLSSLCIFDARERKTFFKNEYLQKFVFFKKYSAAERTTFIHCVVLIRSLISMKRTRDMLIRSDLLEDLARTLGENKVELDEDFNLTALEILLIMSTSSKKHRKKLNTEFQAYNCCIQSKKNYPKNNKIIKIADRILEELYKK